MSETTFEQLLRTQGGFRTQTITRILPPRQEKKSGPRTGAAPSEAARKAADCFYFAATPLAKFLYSKIEERYEILPKEEAYLKRKASLMGEVKSILNEHRNQIVEAVIPLFDIRFRVRPDDILVDDEELPEPDAHARDYFVKNVYTMLCREFMAWLPEFVSEEQMSGAEETLSRLSVSHRTKLESELRNFGFTFRRIVTN